MLGRALIDIIISSLHPFNHKIEWCITSEHDDVLSIWRIDSNPAYFNDGERKYRDHYLLLQVGIEADSDFSPVRGTTTLWAEFTPDGVWGDDNRFVYIGSIDDPQFRIEPVIEIIIDTLRGALQ